jgi:hypothetical protein
MLQGTAQLVVVGDQTRRLAGALEEMPQRICPVGEGLRAA